MTEINELIQQANDLNNEEKHEEALEMMEQAISKIPDPKNEQPIAQSAYFARAMTYLILDRDAEGMRDLETVLELPDENPLCHDIALIQLAMLEYDVNKSVKKAKEHYRQASKRTDAKKLLGEIEPDSMIRKNFLRAIGG